MFQALARRLVVDAGLGAEVFRRVTEDIDDIESLLDRLTLVYDVLMPPPSETP